jgi:hypothetical protein
MLSVATEQKSDVSHSHFILGEDLETHIPSLVVLNGPRTALKNNCIGATGLPPTPCDLDTRIANPLEVFSLEVTA